MDLASQTVALISAMLHTYMQYGTDIGFGYRLNVSSLVWVIE